MGIKLLLADDSPTIGKILSMALQSEAYDIKSVLTAEDAVKELRQDPPFFFLVDLTLPNKDGYEFAKLIRSDSKLSKIKIMLLSSAFDPVDPQKLAESGADGFIVKPFDPSDLRKKLREIADAPPVFPAGSHVSGSVSGFQVDAQKDITPPAPSMEAPLAPAELEISGDADSILAQLMSGDENDLPPAEPPITNPSMTTIGLENTASDLPPLEPVESVLDLSESFSGDRTAMIDFAAQEKEKSLAGLNTPPTTAPIAAQSPSTNEEPLSANAQALSAFFEAELENKPAAAPANIPNDTIPPPAPKSAPPSVAAPAEDEAFFDASSESLEWATPAKESLDSWSSNAPSFTPPQSIPQPIPLSNLQSPPPFSAPKDTSPPAFKKPSLTPQTGSGATSAGNPLFDVGGSNFTFADDYIQRITKAFSGAINEVAVPNIHEGILHSESLESVQAIPSHKPSTSSVGLSSGAWSPEDAKKIEQMVREEVQMVVREVAEKVAWEIIPELAENIIKKELDKVLKQLET